jgi:2-amino-4-hydroxy-6-hydroxymethyldihydropteridine diphosphokinase
MAIAFVAAGANMPGPHGQPEMAVSLGLRAIEGPDLRLVARSRLYASKAWPDPRDPDFVNAVARIDTDLGPTGLLARLHEIEARFGRERRVANAPRTLDLDVIDYDGRISRPGENPVLPHPRMADRAFVLLPLAEVAPNWRHPVTGQTIGDLIANLSDPAAAWPIEP